MAYLNAKMFLRDVFRCSEILSNQHFVKIDCLSGQTHYPLYFQYYEESHLALLINFNIDSNYQTHRLPMTKIRDHIFLRIAFRY